MAVTTLPSVNTDAHFCSKAELVIRIPRYAQEDAAPSGETARIR